MKEGYSLAEIAGCEGLSFVGVEMTDKRLFFDGDCSVGFGDGSP